MVELSDFEISHFSKPNTAGVYAIWSRNMPYESGLEHLLYIGSSKNLFNRLNNKRHHYKTAFNRLSGLVYVSFIETNDYINIENMLIKKHKPILNKQGKIN